LEVISFFDNEHEICFLKNISFLSLYDNEKVKSNIDGNLILFDFENIKIIFVL
jgi:hypothetical protein